MSADRWRPAVAATLAALAMAAAMAASAASALTKAAATAATAASAATAGTTPAGAAPSPSDSRRSGFADMTTATQALQRDDAQNPATLWVHDGAERFAADCARCHRDGLHAAQPVAAGTAAGRPKAIAPATVPAIALSTAPTTAPTTAPATATVAAPSLDGVAARYPAFDAASDRVLTLAGRIDACIERHVGRRPAGPESDERLALETFVGHRSRGVPIGAGDDPRMTPWLERGARLWTQRLGQLQLSCAQCHDDLPGRRLAASPIPQAHPTAYPIYRLEWQTVGSLQRRLRNCMTGVRAEPFAWDSDAFTALETYLMRRAAGMPIETPGVRP